MLKWAKTDDLYHNDDPYLPRRQWSPWIWWPLLFLAVAGGMFAVSIGVFETVMWLKGW